MKKSAVIDNQNEGNSKASIPDIISSLFENMKTIEKVFCEND